MFICMCVYTRKHICTYACKNPLQFFKIFHYQVEKRLSGGRAVRTPFTSMNPVFVRLPLAAKVTTL